MGSHRFIHWIGRFLGLAVLAALISMAGCSGSGHPRGMFSGYVMDKTEAEVVDKIGKPDVVEKLGADKLKWVYRKKTFDPDNENRPDNETILLFKRDPKAGVFKVEAVDFA